jgi:hypothetical protein
VGLRSHYVASCLVAEQMVKQKSGLIVNVSSVGGSRYLFNVRSVGHEACHVIIVVTTVDGASGGGLLLRCAGGLWRGQGSRRADGGGHGA